MKKITLIQPPKPRYNTTNENHWSLTRPLSLHYLASSIIKNTDYQVEIIDFEQKKYRNHDIEKIISSFDSSVFGLTCTTYTRFECIKIIKLIKKFKPGAIIVTGGCHFSYLSEESLREIPEIDTVCRGEGEIVIRNILNALDNQNDFSKIHGITYRGCKGEIIKNPDEIIQEDLNNIDFYPYDYEEYPEYLFGVPDEIPAVSIMSSRGCPYSCIFCAKSGTGYRLLAPEKVADEIEFYIKRFNISAFNFLDLTFTADKKHVTELCNELIRRKLNIKWWCESRANIDLKMLELMKAAGCQALVVGMESGSEKILKSISKGITKKSIIKFLKKCKSINLSASVYFMFSHPGETKKDVYETIDFINQLREYTSLFSFQPSMIFPGTKLEQIARQKNLLPKSFSWNQPYESSLNKMLGQLMGIPLYLEHLKEKDCLRFINIKKTDDEIHSLLSHKMKTIVHQNTPGQLILKLFKQLKNNPKKIVRLILKKKFYTNLFSSLLKKSKDL